MEQVKQRSLRIMHHDASCIMMRHVVHEIASFDLSFQVMIILFFNRSLSVWFYSDARTGVLRANDIVFKHVPARPLSPSMATGLELSFQEHCSMITA
jgi:hypothetical protein